MTLGGATAHPVRSPGRANAFDSPILSYAVKRTAVISAAVAGAAALVVGFAAGRWLLKRKRA